MLKINTLLVVLGISIARFSSAGTLDDLVDSQREILIAEAQRKLDATKPPVPLPQPSVARSTKKTNDKDDADLEDAKLIAIYGPVGQLTAEIMFQGAVFPVKQGGDSVEGWRVDSINQSRIVLQKLDKKGKTIRAQTMYLSAAASNPVATTLPTVAPMMLPPFPSPVVPPYYGPSPMPSPPLPVATPSSPSFLR